MTELMPPEKIMLIRHAEKPTKENGLLGVRENGEHHPESLAVKGWQRAGALISLFSPPPGLELRSGFAVPEFIFATAIKHHINSRRPQETVSLLLAKLRADHREVASVFQYHKEEVTELVADVLARRGAVLICWQHEMIPAIVKLIVGEAVKVPEVWPGDRFDLVGSWTNHRTDGAFSRHPSCFWRPIRPNS
jgi:hypothetical protein